MKQPEEVAEGPSEDVSLKAYFDFIQAFGRRCFNSEPYGWACFHMIIGAMPHIRRLKIMRGDSWLDPRIHVAYLSPSGSGKGEGASFVTDMAKKLNLKVYNATDFTDAALIGTIQTTDDGEPIIHPGLLIGHTKEWNQVEGCEEEVDIDILLVSEASKVLNPRPGPSDALIMNSLQIAMNTYGTSDNLVTKKLAKGPSVSYPTDVTLFLTTFPPVTFADVVLKRGLFQRALTVVKEAMHDERVHVTKEFFKSFYAPEQEIYHDPVNKTVSTKSTEEITDMVVDVIKKANRWARKVEEIHVSEKAAKRLEKLVLKFQNQVKGLSPFLQSKIHEFISRLMGHLVKLSAHVAILNHSEIVEEEHILMVEKLHAPERFEELITYLSNNVEEPKEFTARMKKELKCLDMAQKELAKKPTYRDWKGGSLGWRTVDDFKRTLSVRLRLPESGSTEMLNRHIVWGHMETRTSGKIKFCRLDPKIEVEGNDKKQ